MLLSLLSPVRRENATLPNPDQSINNGFFCLFGFFKTIGGIFFIKYPKQTLFCIDYLNNQILTDLNYGKAGWQINHPEINRVYAENAVQTLILLSASRGLAGLLLGNPVTSTVCLGHSNISVTYTGIIVILFLTWKNLIPRSSAEDHPV